MSEKHKTRRTVLSFVAASAAAGLSYFLATNSTDTRRNQPNQLPIDGNINNSTPGRQVGGANSVDVRNFGAVLDGETDDSLALARSIEAAGAGGVVRIPPGDMLIDRQDAVGAIQLTDSAGNISIVGTSPLESRLVMRSGQSDPHILLQITSGSKEASPEITVGNLTLDGNRAAQNSGPGHAIRSSASGGHLLLQNCLIQNTWNAGLRLTGHMSADIRRCVFRNCGNPEKGGAHAITPNQRSEQATTIQECMFLNTAGSDVDVGIDSDTAYQTCTIDRCYSEGSPRLLKLDPSNAKTTVSNTKFVAGDGAVPSAGIVANNDNAQCGSLALNNVSLANCDGPGINLGAGTDIEAGALDSLRLRDVAIRNVDNKNTREYEGASASGIYAEGTEFVQSGRISIHEVGSDNTGDAVWLNLGCWGEIEAVRHAKTAELGQTQDVTVVRNEAGADPLKPDVPDKPKIETLLTS